MRLVKLPGSKLYVNPDQVTIVEDRDTEVSVQYPGGNLVIREMSVETVITLLEGR